MVMTPGNILALVAIILMVLLYFLWPWSELRRRIRYWLFSRGTDIEGLSRYVDEAQLKLSHPIREDMKGPKGYALATFHPSEQLELRQAIYLFGLVSLAKVHFHPLVLVKDDLLIHRNRRLGVMDPEVSKAQSRKYEDKLRKFFGDRDLHVDIIRQSTLLGNHSRRWIELYMKLGTCLGREATEATMLLEAMAEYDTASPFIERQSALMGAAFTCLLWEQGKRPLVVLCWEKRQVLWSELLSNGIVDDREVRFLYYPTLSDDNYHDVVNSYVICKDEVIKCQAGDSHQRLQEYLARWNEHYDP